MTIISIISVFIGSGCGGVCRWGLNTYFCGHYPLGTFMVNIIGCFLLGFLTKIAPGSEYIRLLFMTGFCGGFTTFSTFINENLFLMRGGEFALSFMYIVASLVIGLSVAWLGYHIPLR